MSMKVRVRAFGGEPMHPNETMDGIMFGMALAANPKVTARREAYHASLRADRATLSGLSRETLAHAIAERRLWTLPEAFEQNTTADMIEAVARCMQGHDRPLWLASLGLNEAPKENHGEQHE